MKKFSVSIDITMSKTIEIEAESENTALAKADELVKENPYSYAKDFTHYVTHEVIEATEEE